MKKYLADIVIAIIYALVASTCFSMFSQNRISDRGLRESLTMLTFAVVFLMGAFTAQVLDRLDKK